MKSKKIIASVLALAMVCGCNAYTDSGYTKNNAVMTASAFEKYGDFTYSKYDDHIEIIGCAYDIEKVEIPSEIEGLPVTVISESAFFEHTSLTSIIIPDSVTTIGGSAFSCCSSLASITIPDSVTSIYDSTFNNCESLESIVIPDSVTSIGDYAFSGCKALKSITIPNSVTSIGACAFAKCESLTSITIPDSITAIDFNVFVFCSNLTSVTIPDSVTTIYGSAFAVCPNLTSITIPASVTSIGDDVFWACDKVTIKGYSGSYAQEYAEKNNIPFVAIGSQSVTTTTTTKPVTTTTTTKASTTTTKKATTTTSKTTTTAKPTDSANSGECGENVTWTLDSEGTLTISGTGEMRNYNIFESPFYENQKIKNIIIEDGVTSIGANAFECCWLLNKITIPDSVTSIGDDAFYDCQSLKSVPIPDSVTSIGDDAFYDCLNLTSITIPASVTSIGKDAFWGCYQITIKGYSGSCAQEYAEKNDIPFVAIGSQSVTTTTTNPASKVLYGDANADGEVSLADAVLILQSISSPDKYGENGSDKNHITAQGAKNADVYERGSGLTPQDALQIQKYLSKLITTLE